MATAATTQWFDFSCTQNDRGFACVGTRCLKSSHWVCEEESQQQEQGRVSHSLSFLTVVHISRLKSSQWYTRQHKIWISTLFKLKNIFLFCWTKSFKVVRCCSDLQCDTVISRPVSESHYTNSAYSVTKVAPPLSAGWLEHQTELKVCRMLKFSTCWLNLQHTAAAFMTELERAVATLHQWPHCSPGAPWGAPLTPQQEQWTPPLFMRLDEPYR